MPLSFLLLIDSVMGALVGACGKSRRADSAPRVGALLDLLICPYGVKGRQKWVVSPHPPIPYA
jgi:hypothetical protein